MADTDQDKTELGGENAPGTSGDVIDGTDVEGHRRSFHLPSADGGPEELGKPIRYPLADGGDEDVEGHRRNFNLPGADGGPEELGKPIRYPLADGTEDDVEGHIYTGGPSTQGEFAKRVPTENPHGER